MNRQINVVGKPFKYSYFCVFFIFDKNKLLSMFAIVQVKGVLLVFKCLEISKVILNLTILG